MERVKYIRSRLSEPSSPRPLSRGVGLGRTRSGGTGLQLRMEGGQGSSGGRAERFLRTRRDRNLPPQSHFCGHRRSVSV